MKSGLLKYIILSFVFMWFSCAKEIDFTQGEDLEISPIMEVSLVYLDEPASGFMVNNSPAVLHDDAVMGVFSDQFVVDNLTRADLFFEIGNSIDRNLLLTLNFYDVSDQLQHSISIPIPSSPNNEVIVTEHTEVLEGTSLEALKRTERIEFILEVDSGNPVDDDTLGRIYLKSKGTFYFNIDTSE
ncbi:MAG: hypothetical protein ACK5MZ_04590 [Aestuariibaculum sp.]